MSIKPIKGLRGEEQAFCVCEDCGGEKVVSTRHGCGGGATALTLHSQSSVIQSLEKLGWSNIKNRLRCNKCTAARKSKEAPVPTKNNVEPIRQPTPEQEVDIIVMLSSAYDRKARCYHGKESDKTVAEAVGSGVMPGWVSAIREAKFGPAGNEEISSIRAEMLRMQAECDAMRETLSKALRAVEARLSAVVAAHDKRVG